MDRFLKKILFSEAHTQPSRLNSAVQFGSLPLQQQHACMFSFGSALETVPQIVFFFPEWLVIRVSDTLTGGAGVVRLLCVMTPAIESDKLPLMLLCPML